MEDNTDTREEYPLAEQAITFTDTRSSLWLTTNLAYYRESDTRQRGWYAQIIATNLTEDVRRQIGWGHLLNAPPAGPFLPDLNPQGFDYAAGRRFLYDPIPGGPIDYLIQLTQLLGRCYLDYRLNVPAAERHAAPRLVVGAIRGQRQGAEILAEQVLVGLQEGVIDLGTAPPYLLNWVSAVKGLVAQQDKAWNAADDYAQLWAEAEAVGRPDATTPIPPGYYQKVYDTWIAERTLLTELYHMLCTPGASIPKQTEGVIRARAALASWYITPTLVPNMDPPPAEPEMPPQPGEREGALAARLDRAHNLLSDIRRLALKGKLNKIQRTMKAWHEQQIREHNGNLWDGDAAAVYSDRTDSLRYAEAAAADPDNPYGLHTMLMQGQDLGDDFAKNLQAALRRDPNLPPGDVE